MHPEVLRPFEIMRCRVELLSVELFVVFVDCVDSPRLGIKSLLQVQDGKIYRTIVTLRSAAAHITETTQSLWP